MSCDPDEQRVRGAVLQRLAADPETYLARYENGFGNVLNADDAATLFDEYNLDRAKYRVAVHPAAVWIRDELFRRALTRDVPAERAIIAFTAGSNAAGKSSAIKFTHASEGALAVLDSTLSSPKHARRLIGKALDAGKRVTVLYVNRPLNETFPGMFERYEVEGRIVSIGQILASHRGAAETVRSLWREFHLDPRFAFRFVANSITGIAEGTIELATPQDYTKTREALDELLDAEYRAGRITEEICRRVRGGG